jgi:hypothetical protein
VQTKAERRENDAIQTCHWTISLLKRWLLGTHAVRWRLSICRPISTSFAFRYNRPRTNGAGRTAGRHRTASATSAADHALIDRRHPALPLVPPI